MVWDMPVFHRNVQEAKRATPAEKSKSQLPYAQEGNTKAGHKIFKRSVTGSELEGSNSTAKQAAVAPPLSPVPPSLLEVDTTATSRNSIGRPELYSPDSPSSPQSPNRTSSTPETNVIAFESRTERLLNMHKRLEEETKSQAQSPVKTSSQGASLDIRRSSLAHRLQSSGPSLNSIPSRRVVDFTEQPDNRKISPQKRMRVGIMRRLVSCFHGSTTSLEQAGRQGPGDVAIHRKSSKNLATGLADKINPTPDPNCALSPTDLLRKSITMLSTSSPCASARFSAQEAVSADIHPAQMLRKSQSPLKEHPNGNMKHAAESAGNQEDPEPDFANGERGLFRSSGKSLMLPKPKHGEYEREKHTDSPATDTVHANQSTPAAEVPATENLQEIGLDSTSQAKQTGLPAQEDQQEAIGAAETLSGDSAYPNKASAQSEEAELQSELDRLSRQAAQGEKASRLALRKWTSSQERLKLPVSPRQGASTKEPDTPRSMSGQPSSPIWSIKAIRYGPLGDFGPAPRTPRSPRRIRPHMEGWRHSFDGAQSD